MSGTRHSTPPTLPSTIIVDMWSDIVCPWCYIGKRRLEAAIARSAAAVTVRHRAYQLHPSAPADRSLPIREFWPLVYPNWTRTASDDSLVPIVAAGDELGLVLDYDIMQSCNTRTAHRLTKWAETLGRADEMIEALYHGYFTEGARLNDRNDLARLAVNAGLDAGAAHRIVNTPELHDDQITADLVEAQQLGATGVPFQVFADRFAVPGAVQIEQLVRVLETVRDRAASTGTS